MEVDEAIPKDSEKKSEEEVELVTEEELAMEIAIREEFIQNLANKAMISQDHIQELYKKYVKRPRKYKDYEVSKSAATHLALAAKHFVAHVLQMGLQHHLSKKPDEFTVDYDDMADAVASDPRMKKLQGMLPRRITAAEALKLRAMKLKHTQKAANRDMAEILAFEQPQLAPALGKSKAFADIELLKEKMRQRTQVSVDEPESLEIKPAENSQKSEPMESETNRPSVQKQMSIETNESENKEETLSDKQKTAKGLAEMLCDPSRTNVQLSFENGRKATLELARNQEVPSQGDIVRPPFKEYSLNSPKAPELAKKSMNLAESQERAKTQAETQK